MKINSCVVVIKQTALAQGGRAAQFARRGDATARGILKADVSHQRTIETVRQTLQQRGIAAVETSLQTLNAKLKRQLANADLIVAVGGDGTALGTSHFVTRGALLGVNSAPTDSVGHFCSLHAGNFAAKLDALLKDVWRPTELSRLSVTLNDKPLPELALNDVLIAHDCPAATTRYLIQCGKREEEHRSSGIWISTAAGSTAGIHSAGGRKMALRSTRLQFLVRELYHEVLNGKQRAYQLECGMLAASESLTIASKMPEGWLYIDGARTAYRFPFGARATISAAALKLRIFLNRQ